MTVWMCRGCSSMWGAALTRCPRCHGTDWEIEEGFMPKISRAAGASNAEGGRPAAVVRVKQTLTDREAKQLKARLAEHGTEGDPPSGAEAVQVEDEGGEQSSAGNSSEASSGKQRQSSRKTGRGSRQPARTTESPSSEDLTESRFVPTTDGAPETDTSETDNG